MGCSRRVGQAGGFVADGRVNGSLNLSRALGDMEYKQSADLAAEDQIVTAVPEVRPSAPPAAGRPSWHSLRIRLGF